MHRCCGGPCTEVAFTVLKKLDILRSLFQAREECPGLTELSYYIYSHGSYGVASIKTSFLQAALCQCAAPILLPAYNRETSISERKVPWPMPSWAPLQSVPIVVPALTLVFIVSLIPLGFGLSLFNPFHIDTCSQQTAFSAAIEL